VPSAFNVEVAVEKLNRHKSPGSDQIPPELIKARSGTICSEFLNLISSVWLKRNCLSSGRIQSLYLFIRRMIKPIVVIIEVYHFVNYIQNFTLHPAVKVNSIWRGNC